MTIHLSVKGPSGVQSFERDAYGTFLVGRSEEAQICVSKDRHFSRRHCWIEIAPPQAKVVDLKSHNGTFVNGNRINTAWLKNGDVISGGQTEIRIHMPGDNDDKTVTLHAPAKPSPLPNTVSLAVSPRPQNPVKNPQTKRQRISRYELLHEVGRGSMGVVYKARQLPSRQLVALKLIIPARAVDEKQVQLFLREASVLSSLDHDRIVRLLEIGIDAGRLFFAMEFVEHRSLEEWSKKLTQPRQIRLACGVAAQVLDALDYAHRQGVVHRDIKPTNVLLAQENNRLAVRVVDFGLAKNYVESGFSGITEPGEVRGTMGFIAPEQLIDSQKANPASDLFSVGATLYHYLCGKYPYDVAEDENPIPVILNQRPVSLRERNLDLPESLIAFVDRATEPELERRFTSAAEMRQSLDPFLRKQ